MAAIEHQHRGTRALIFGLVDVEIGIFKIQRQFDALSLHGAKKCGADIQIENVAELILLGPAAGIDTGGQVTRVVRSKARLAK